MQQRWLRAAVENAREEGASRVIVFQHHPWFLKTADEPDQYFNIPRERRVQYLALFHEFGLKHLFSGHYHRNAVARDAEIEAITTGPVGMGGAGSSNVTLKLARVGPYYDDAHAAGRAAAFGQLTRQIETTARSAFEQL